MKGVLPERQAQRMIQQYDEEQILLERRVQELESQIQQETVKKADTERFLALVRKYRDCTELTDAMLYSFIDRVEVHEATAGALSTASRTSTSTLISSAATTHLLKLCPRKNGLPP